MAWETPIFDRTEEDVLKVITYDNIGYKYLTQDQKEEWDNGLKGALNYTDVNRIEGNIQYLFNIYGIVGMTIKTNWNYTDIVTDSEFQRILYNIYLLKKHFKIYETTPAIPPPPINTYQKVNEIEKILYDMYFIYENGSLAFARNDPEYKAELYANDDITVI